MAKWNLKDVLAKLANVGVQGKTALLHFFPVMKKGQKVIATRPCGCGYKHALVLRAKEDPNVYLVLCPKCHKHEYKVPAKDNRIGETEDDKCKGRTKKKSACKNWAMANGYCKTHQDQAPDIAANV